MSKNTFQIGNYVVPRKGMLSNLPMKIKAKHDGRYTVEHPTTHNVFTFDKDSLRAAKRKEIEAIRVNKWPA